MVTLMGLLLGAGYMRAFPLTTNLTNNPQCAAFNIIQLQRHDDHRIQDEVASIGIL